MELIERLKDLRIKNNLKQKDICEKFNFSYTQYNNWERGRAEPDIQALISLSEFYNVSIDYLVGKTDDDTVGNFEKEFKKLSSQDQILVYNLICTINKNNNEK